MLWKAATAHYFVAEELYVLSEVKNVRSKIDCTIICYNDEFCRSAVFTHIRTCVLLLNFPAVTNFDSGNLTADIVAFKAFSTAVGD